MNAIAMDELPRVPVAHLFSDIAMQKNVKGYVTGSTRISTIASSARSNRREPLMKTLVAIARRVLTALPSLVGVVVVTFLLARALPGDPAAYYAGSSATPESIAQIRAQLGFDRPLIAQFGDYVCGSPMAISATRSPRVRACSPISRRGCRPPLS